MAQLCSENLLESSAVSSREYRFLYSICPRLSIILKMSVLIEHLFQTLYEYAPLSALPHALRHENLLQQLKSIASLIHSYKLPELEVFYKK